MLFRSIVDRGVGRWRQNGRAADSRWPTYPLSSLLEGYQCVQHDQHVSYGNLGDSVPPFGMAFCHAGEQQNVLAVANEEGVVRLYNTESRGNPLLKEWLAHENAVFDIAWIPRSSHMVTAAGDQMARLWDVKSGDLLGNFKGHLCSLKSVAIAPQENDVFCTGARDGNIMLWDTRCSKKDGFYKPTNQITGAHNKAEQNPSTKAKKRRGSCRGMAPSVDSQQSVTVVLFQDQHTLISSGAVDGVIKMWDLRKNFTLHRHDPVPLQTFPYPGSSMRMRLGYSGLVMDSTRSNVFCNCTDDSIYMFNVSGVKTAPVAVFSGHKNSSFYIKSTVSPNDQFLASGSSDHHTYIWKISDPTHPPVMLQGHSEEVTSVAWCPTDFTKIASCSDDHTVRIWRLRRKMDGAPSAVGQANLVGWARAKPPTTALLQAETTPAKVQRSKRFGGPSSPQPAACAPCGAALPPPSSTNTSPQPSREASVPKLRTPTSIKQWLTPSPARPPPRQVLSPCPQSSTASTSPAERRAKRRLETGDGPLTTSHKAAEGCDGVIELDPAAKRSRAQPGITCSIQDTQTKPNTEDNEQASGSNGGKENFSPGRKDWLSAISQKKRRGQGSSQVHKSPIAAKKPEGKIPASPTIRSPQTMKKISTYFATRPQE